MRVVKCANGHFFDRDSYINCPVCGGQEIDFDPDKTTVLTKSCPYCGFLLADTDVFCPNCGNAVQAQEESGKWADERGEKIPFPSAEASAKKKSGNKWLVIVGLVILLAGAALWLLPKILNQDENEKTAQSSQSIESQAASSEESSAEVSSVEETVESVEESSEEASEMSSAEEESSVEESSEDEASEGSSEEETSEEESSEDEISEDEISEDDPQEDESSEVTAGNEPDEVLDPDDAQNRQFDLEIPKITTLESNKKGKVFLEWKTVENAQIYRIFRYGEDTGHWEILKDTVDTSYTDEAVDNYIKYHYAIRVVDSKKEEYLSGYKIKGDIMLRPAPVLKQAARTEKGVEVTWEAVERCERYKIYRKTDGSWKKIGESTENSFVDTTAKEGTAYIYTVRCLTASGKTIVSGYDPNGVKVEK